MYTEDAFQAEQLKQTPLVGVHHDLGAKMTDFAGWHMPVQYEGVLAEHRAVRQAAGLFDLSHMGQLWLTGPDALANVQRLLTNDASQLSPGSVQYTFLTNDAGGIVDDLLLYCVDPETYLLVVNAANIQKANTWIQARLQGEALLDDRSPDTALLAVQGPWSEAIVQSLCDDNLADIRPFKAIHTTVAAVPSLVSRTGYTGEDGFEIMVKADAAVTLWLRLMQAGKPKGMVPVGLGARDTLRLEARLPLYGNELNEKVTPLEAGLSFFVSFDKGDFIGRDALQQQKDAGPDRRLIGFVMEERAIPRHGYHILADDGQPLGTVTSGSFAPSLKQQIGLGYVAAPHAVAGHYIWIQVRHQRVPARIIKGRFLARSTP